LRFVRGVIRFTQTRAIFRAERFWTAESTDGADESSRIVWHGVHLGEPDWGHDSRSLAFELRCPKGDDHLHVMLNAYWEPLAFELPPLPDGLQRARWHRVVDTALPSPDDFRELEAAPPVGEDRYRVEARSAVVLIAQRAK
jgi:isoamylase